MTSNQNAISITGLQKAYGPTRALIDANLTVKAGESRALLGRNGAGKSTLIGILTGLVKADAGIIHILNSAGDYTDGPGADSVACVYQKSTLVPELTAAENISLGSYPRRRGGLVDWRTLRAKGGDVLEEWGFEHVLDRPVVGLEPLERKVVEVCRALSQGPRILLLDEPTAGLDDGAAHELFAQIENARERGVTVLYVSHHLEEIFKVCDSVTILRDGRDVLTAPTSSLDVDSIVNEMAGMPKADGGRKGFDPHAVRAARTVVAEREPALEVRGAKVGKRVAQVDLSVVRGESVGLTGLDGSGHIQLAQAIAGQLRLDGGSVSISGRQLGDGSVIAAVRSGIGFVPEDRHINGFIPDMSVEENSTMTILDRIRGFGGFVSPKLRRQRYEHLAGTWSIKCDGPTQAVSELSGGNQQKVVLARALASDPEALVLIHPTAGVDVTAKESIYESLMALQESGRSLLIASSDDDDLAICDRVVVMYKGRVHAVLQAGYEEHELVAAVQGAKADLR